MNTTTKPTMLPKIYNARITVYHDVDGDSGNEIDVFGVDVRQLARRLRTAMTDIARNDEWQRVSSISSARVYRSTTLPFTYSATIVPVTLVC